MRRFFFFFFFFQTPFTWFHSFQNTSHKSHPKTQNFSGFTVCLYREDILSLILNFGTSVTSNLNLDLDVMEVWRHDVCEAWLGEHTLSGCIVYCKTNIMVQIVLRMITVWPYSWTTTVNVTRNTVQMIKQMETHVLFQYFKAKKKKKIEFN